MVRSVIKYSLHYNAIFMAHGVSDIEGSPFNGRRRKAVPVQRGRNRKYQLQYHELAAGPACCLVPSPEQHGARRRIELYWPHRDRILNRTLIKFPTQRTANIKDQGLSVSLMEASGDLA